jgi:hypothetical protein
MNRIKDLLEQAQQSKWWPNRKWFAAAIANAISAALIAAGVDLGGVLTTVGEISGVTLPGSEAVILGAANLAAFYLTGERETAFFLDDEEDVPLPDPQPRAESGRPPEAAGTAIDLSS